MMDRKAETAIVKRVLRGMGLSGFRARHGTGTAWGWLEIYLPEITTSHRCIDSRIPGGQPVQELTTAERGASCIYYRCLADCPACTEWRERRRRVIAIVQEATGRTGEYNGSINIYG